MMRREFIALFAGASVVVPLAALAQQPPARRAVLVMGYPPGDPAGQARLNAFVEVLARHGWSDGRNVRLDVRWVGADVARGKAIAVEFGTRPAA